MEDYETLMQIKKKIDAMKKEADNLAGKEELLVKQLQEVSGVSTIKEAEEKITILRKKNALLEGTIKEGIAKIERKFQ